MTKPLAIDLFCGLGGWTDGLLAEGWDVVGFDIERHEYGEHRYPAQLVIQDVLTLHGSQFRHADLIVASPPCTEYSYMAMPWTRAKRIAAALRGEAEFPEDYRGSRTAADLNRLFDACFRIQREASTAAGRHVPLIVENVKGAQPWIGRARWNFGSFYLWGDTPALMPRVARYGMQHGRKTQRHSNRRDGYDHTRHLTNPAEHGVTQRGSGRAWFDRALDERRKNPAGFKNPGIELGSIGFNVASAQQFGGIVEGVKIKRSDNDKRQHIGIKRKFASAMIAKIPEPLSRWIAASFKSKEMICNVA